MKIVVPSLGTTLYLRCHTPLTVDSLEENVKWKKFETREILTLKRAFLDATSFI